MHAPRPIARQATAASFAVLLAFVTAFTAGCSRAPGAPLRIAISPWPGYEYLYLAQERGLLREEGVAVQLVELESLGDSRAAFENGSVDAFCATLVELTLSHAQGTRNPRAFFLFDWSDGADVLLADSTVRTLADLRGKRIALEAGSIDVIALWAALANAGLSLRDVELAPMPQNEKDWAFTRGGVQAVQCFPPTSIELERQRGVHRLFDSSLAPGLIADVAVADSATLARDPERFRAVVRAIWRARDWAEAHPDEANAIMAARENQAPDEFVESLRGIHLPTREEQRSQLASGGPAVRAAERTRRALVEIGTLPDHRSDCTLVTDSALPKESAR